jgi:hypothetical protein
MADAVAEETGMTASDGPRTTDVDAVVIGAGFSGLYMLHKLRNQMGLSPDPPMNFLVIGVA